MNTGDLLDAIVRRSRGQEAGRNQPGNRAALVQSILARRGRRTPRDALTEWLVESKDEIARVRKNLKDMDAPGDIDFATLSVAIREIERLT